MSTSHNEPSTATFGPRQRGVPAAQACAVGCERGVPAAHACAVGCERSGPVGKPSRRTTRLRVLVADERGRSVPAHGLASWLRRVAPAKARGTVSIALVSDDRIRALNRRYRGKDGPTDVLSFPSSPPENSSPRRTRRTKRLKPFLSSASSVSPVVESFLGDIVIARGVAKRQARDAGHGEATELRVLALHGLLHLLGYDHECDDGRMRRVEERLRRRGGLDEGLIRRRSVSGYTRSQRPRPERAQQRERAERGWGPASIQKSREGVDGGGGAPRRKKRSRPRAVKKRRAA